MKTLIFCICSALISGQCNEAKAETLIAINDGYWHNASTWDLKRLPTPKDIVLIPKGISVKIAENIQFIDLESTTEKIIVMGNLLFQKNNILRIDSEKSIEFGKEGKISTSLKSVKALIIVNETKIWDSRISPIFRGSQSYGHTVSAQEVLRYKDTMLVTWDIHQDTSIAFYEVQHSFDGTGWTPIFRQKAVEENDVAMHYICLENIKCQGNVDFVKVVSYDFQGNPKILLLSCLRHNSVKNGRVHSMTMFPKTLFAIGSLHFIKYLPLLKK